ncbi:MAG: hypothetical protein VXZ12_04215, partial [SAR324 cluster bacterium]|nr:hypothetical protein [SAR324 cluster bacterium]
MSKDQTDVTNTIKIDTSIPTLSVVSLSGGTNNLVNEGDLVTLKFTGSENIKDPMVLLSGNRKTLQGTRSNWITTFTVKAKDDAGRQPLGMEGLTLWLDASNIDGRFNTSLNDGDAIAEWKDLSGKYNNAVQENTSLRPLFSNDSIIFDGSSQFFTIPNNVEFGNDQFEYFVVTEFSGNASDPLGSPFTARVWGSNGHNLYVNEGSWEFWNAHDGGAYDEMILGLPSDLNETLIINNYFNDSVAYMIQNGSSSIQKSMTYITNTSTNLFIGVGTNDGVSAFDFYYYGKIKEILYFNKKLFSEERVDLTNYLSSKWNLNSIVDSDADGILDFEDDAPTDLIVEPKPVLFNIVFEDQAGNLGIIVDNTTDSSFVGIDTTIPKLLDVSIISNNLDNSTARKDDQVTLSFK